MRKLNKEEVEILQKLKARNKVTKGLVSPPETLKVDYIRQGNVTMAVVDNKRKTLFGWSKYNPADSSLGIPFSETVGERLALRRALTSK